MNEVVEQAGSENDSYRRYIPLMTSVIAVVSILLFIGINTENDLDILEAYKKWGAPSASDIFSGSYWGMITSNFLHTNILHIGFNLYWLWIFGKKVEYESNLLFYAFLVLSSALVSSAAQMSFSDNTGIGLSGIGYGLFGYIFISGITKEAYKNFLDRGTTILFIAWLFICILTTQTGLFTVGNAAHIAGMTWGALCACLTRLSPVLRWPVSVAVLCLIFSMIFWSPFSNSYLVHKAYKLHDEQKLDEAAFVYKKILERDEENSFAKSNLNNIEIYQMSNTAYAYHEKGQYGKARELYYKILSIDSTNKFARENLRHLPFEITDGKK